MRSKVCLVLILIFLTVSMARAQGEKTDQVSILGGLGDISEKILKNRGQPMAKEGDILILYVSDRGKCVANLLECARALRKKLTLTLENIENRNLYFDPESSGPYRRKIFKIDDNGIISVERDSEVRFVFDPDNPLAIREGQYKGYVASPNVNLAKEKSDFARTAAQYRTIGEILRVIDRTIILQDPEAQ